ncbi:LysE family translocator [Methylocystis iwaonis]|uniref:LysE family translocator n=1 Tax=Methylocystis iwaonis TaxID=2885079 RepID=UPI002E7B006F|nr:LysE family translocator [Methylocystis iwaonis]
MSLSSLFLFASVYLAAVATPGPGIAALVARVLTHGLKGVAPFIAGYVVGDLVWMGFAATGLSVVAHEFAPLFIMLKYAGAAYLIYVAWGLARTPASPEIGNAPVDVVTGWRAFFGSLSLTLGNPKVIVFFLTILPLVLDVGSLPLMSFFEVVATGTLVLSGTLWAYALAADRARGWMRSSRAMMYVRRSMAGVMAGVAVTVATR